MKLLRPTPDQISYHNERILMSLGKLKPVEIRKHSGVYNRKGNSEVTDPQRLNHFGFACPMCLTTNIYRRNPLDSDKAYKYSLLIISYWTCSECKNKFPWHALKFPPSVKFIAHPNFWGIKPYIHPFNPLSVRQINSQFFNGQKGYFKNSQELFTFLSSNLRNLPLDKKVFHDKVAT